MKLSKSILLVVSSVILGNYCVQAQDLWKMQRVPIQTRWGKGINPQKVLPEYPRPQMVRSQWQNINGLWDYIITADNVTSPESYDGKILVPYPVESSLSGVARNLQPDQRLWYKRFLPDVKYKKGERVLLHFGAVDWQCEAFINGKPVGNHTGGYDNFTFDITDALNEKQNTLVVKVYDPTDKGPNPHGKQVLNPSGIMYTPSSGIWQTAWLETVPATYIDNLKMTPDIDNGLLKVQVNISGDSGDMEIVASAVFGGKSVGTVRGSANKPLMLSVPNAHLWSPSTPSLYDLKVKLVSNGKVIDAVSSYFGMRKIEIKKDTKGTERIFLNNQYVYNLGVLDQGFWPDGLYTAPTDESLRFDIGIIKSMGYNTIRKHIKIEPARWYYHADKLGIMVWQDMVNPANESKEAQNQFERENVVILRQLHNYPCITTWVLFNEGWATYDQARLTRLLKEADPSRVVNGHSGENYYRGSAARIQDKWPGSDLTDVHAYPEPNISPALAGKARVLGEYGGIGVSLEGHLWDDMAGWGYVKLTPSGLSEKYQEMLLSLKHFEEQGLSGSIYTQPFDVETEQNGLITYDREVIKISPDTLRKWHGDFLAKPISFQYANSFVARVADTTDPDSKYPARLEQFANGTKDSVFLRRLALMALRLNDTVNAKRISSAYIAGLKDLYAKENLRFIWRLTFSSTDKGFTFFMQNASKVDEVLGKDVAEDKVMDIIDLEEIQPVVARSGGSPNWDEIEKTTVDKFGALGEEKVWGMRMIYYFGKKDWNNYGKSYLQYFKKYGWRFHGAGNLNNFAWSVFENISDKEILEEALKWSYKAVQESKSIYTVDTYANLLYKLGRKQEAIKWQEEAIQLNPEFQASKENLRKMQKDEKTW